MDKRIGSAAEQRVNKKNPVFIDLQSIFSSMMPAALKVRWEKNATWNISPTQS